MVTRCQHDLVAEGLAALQEIFMPHNNKLKKVEQSKYLKSTVSFKDSNALAMRRKSNAHEVFGQCSAGSLKR